MGCDVHMYAEKFNPQNKKWEKVGNKFYDVYAVGNIKEKIKHNFGLTDLYGSESGPKLLSIMDSGYTSMLNYEKAVLGWFPVENFKCSGFRIYHVAKLNYFYKVGSNSILC